MSTSPATTSPAAINSTTEDASTARSAPTSPKSAKSKHKNKNKAKSKTKDTADSADHDATSPTSPTAGAKGKKTKSASSNSISNSCSNDQSHEQTAEPNTSTAGEQEHAGPAAKGSKRTKRTRKPSTGTGSGGDGAGAADHPKSAVSAALVEDVVDGSDQAPMTESTPKRKRDGPKKKGGKKNSGESSKGVAGVEGHEGGDESGAPAAATGGVDGAQGSGEPTAVPKQRRQRSNSKALKPSGAADGVDAASDPSAADMLVASASTRSPKTSKGSRSKSGRKQDSSTTSASAGHGDAADQPEWTNNPKSDAEDQSQWHQHQPKSAPARINDHPARKPKSARKEANRTTGTGLDTAAQPEWTTSAKSDAEDESTSAHTNSGATSAAAADGTSVATQTATAAPKYSQQQRREHGRDGHARQQRRPGPAAADGEQQMHPSKSRDSRRRRPSNAGGDGEQQTHQQRRDSYQPAQRRQDGQGQGDGNGGGGRRRKNSENSRGQPQQRNPSGGRARAASGSMASVDGAGHRPQQQQRPKGGAGDARVDEVAATMQNVSLNENKQEVKSATKLEHSPPYSPTKPNPSVDIREALGPDFNIHVKQIKESLSALDIKYADPSTWSDTYPEDVRFRPFYFHDQSIPIPADSTVLFPPPWAPASWDQACEPPAHPVSMFTRLSLELFAFSEHVKMSPVDEFLRTCAYSRLEAMVSKLLPDGCEMFVFGSSASPLSNPNSDLDVGIFPRNPNNLTLESGRQQARRILDPLFRYILVIAAPRSVESVFNAKVPLIKYTDRATGVEVDVSVQWEGGESVDIVYALAAKYPALVPMVRTIKSMLSLHSLNSSRDGGIHGFCVLSLVAGFLGRLEAMGLGVSVDVTEREGRVYPPPHMHGLAFLAFLHFVGFVWDPATTGMDNTNGGALFYRHAKCDRDYQNHILLVTSVRPQATPENVGRSVRAETWVAFRSICQYAFMRLYQSARTQIAPPAPGSAAAAGGGSSSLLSMFLTVPPRYRKAMEAAEDAIDKFSQYSKYEGVGDFNTWVEMVLSKEKAYFRRKFEEVSEQMSRRGGGGGRGGGNQGQGGRGGYGGGGGGPRNQPQNRPSNAGQQDVNQGQARDGPPQGQAQGPPARGQPNPRPRKSTRDESGAPADTDASEHAPAVNGDGDGDGDGDNDAQVAGEEKKKKPKKAKTAKRDRERKATGESATTNEAAGEAEEGEIVKRVEHAFEQLVLEEV